MTPLYTAFFTRNTIYEREAARLRASLERLGLEHHIVAVDSCGDWIANSRLTALHVWAMMATHHDRPIVQLDADAFVWRRPELFDSMPPQVDVAVHYRRGVELLNGTVYFAPTDAARECAQRYLKNIEANPLCTNEQTMLAAAIADMGKRLNVLRLPPEYCWIHDIMRDDLGGADPVIEHLQASRSARGVVGEPIDNRHKRLADIERWFASENEQIDLRAAVAAAESESGA